MINHEPHIQETKSHSRNDEEVHRSDVVRVVAKKRHPSLLFARIGRSLREIARDSCEADGKTELLELGLDLPGTPSVFACQPTNERLQFLRDRWPQVRGRWALARQSGQRPNYEHDHKWFRLDLGSGDLAELPLDQELAVRGRRLGRVELVDPDFTLILVTNKNEDPQEVWSRGESRSLQRLAVTDHYYGATEGQIWWYDVAARAGARSDYISGATVRERRANFAMPRNEPTHRCEAIFDGNELLYQEKIQSGWQTRRLVVPAS